MENLVLKDFVASSRAAGVPEQTIRAQLSGSGWPVADIESVLGSGQAVVSEASSVPAPGASSAQPSGNDNMWIVFEYILMFITLAFSATAMAGLAHHMVDQFVTDQAAAEGNYYSLSYYSDYLVPFYAASLIISFPIFAYLALKLRGQLFKNPAIRSIRVRRIFIFIALLWTFVVLMVRLIRTVYEFLSGDSFVVNGLLHLVVTLLIAGSIFYYFVKEVKQRTA